MISYYELLTMIKENDAPKKIRVHLTPNTSNIYVNELDIDGSLNYYALSQNARENEEYKYYLTECFIESSVFDKCIEIVEGSRKLKKIETDEDGNIVYYGEDGVKHRINTNLKDRDIYIKIINKIIDIIGEEDQ